MHMDWGEVLTNVLVAMVTVFLPVILGLMLSWLKPYIAKLDKEMEIRIGKGQWQFTKALIEQFVNAAEQVGVPGSVLEEGARKKEWVKQSIYASLLKYNLDIDMDAIDAAIEQAVLQMNFDMEPDYIVPDELLPSRAVG